MAGVEDRVREVLAVIVDPHTGVDLVAGGALKAVVEGGGRVAVDLVLGYPARSWLPVLRDQVATALAAAGFADALVGVDQRVVAHEVRAGLTPLPQVRNIIAVASGKGGVATFPSSPITRRELVPCSASQRPPPSTQAIRASICDGSGIRSQV